MSASIGENSRVQQYVPYPMIESAGKTFMKDEIDKLMRSSPKFSAIGAPFNVVTIIGVQGIGKSTLLNSIFGCNFDVTKKGKEQQKKMKGLWASECSIPNLLVVDVDASDNRLFQLQSIHFAFTISNVVIFYIYIPERSNMDRETDRFLHEIFKARMMLEQENTRLLVVVRDASYDSGKVGSKDNLVGSTLSWLRREWRYNTEEGLFTDYRNYFDVTVLCLSHEGYALRFEYEIAIARKWFETKAFAWSQHHKMAAIGFSFSAEKLWKHIFEDTELDIPAHRGMVSRYICDEAKKQCLIVLKNDEDYLSLKKIESPQEFSDKLESVLERLKNRYMLETETCGQELRDKKENKLIDNIIRDTSTYSQKLVTGLQSKMYDSSVQRIRSATVDDPYVDVHGLVKSCVKEFTDACQVLLLRYPTIISEDITSAMESGLLTYAKEVQNMQINMIEMGKNLELGRANIEKEIEDAGKRIDLYQTNDYIEFSFGELQEATDNFHKSCMIGEGGFGLVYKGTLRETVVAIKVPKPGTDQGDDFNREVDILSKVRHPNLISLIGANTEARALVFEFLPSGGLDTFLTKGKLSWPDRIRIAAEICSGLVFLHSVGKHGIVHGDLKPANILLDSNLVCKITDFGNSRELQQVNKSTITALHQTTDIKGTIAYFDPVYLSTGQLTRQSDVFAFGIILLQLVTDKNPEGIRDIVERALDNYTFDTVVYGPDGEWPIDAKKLASLGLLCSDPDRAKRPDMEKYVLPSIENIHRATNIPE